jgi:ATP-independent RNA helicase DbpA
LPPLLEGRDVIARSKTGSGKTVAFTLPILQTLDLDDRAVQALIIAPTRELAAQVAREVRRVGRRMTGLQVLELAGGTPFKPQAESLARGAHVAVGTPGRLLDHVERGTLDLARLNKLVLDEADRMLDMGFVEDVGRIIARTPPTRQTMLFSATIPPEIERLSRRVQKKAVSVAVEEDAAVAQIRQIVVPVEAAGKPALLTRVLRAHPGSALIFCTQKATIAAVVETLNREHLSAAALHGDLEQRDRDRILAMFRNGSIERLVATDVAGRGLDIDHLDLIVNYDLPHDVDTFVHRVGRTGRAGRDGLAVSFGNDVERARVREFAREKGYDIERADGRAFKPTREAAVRQVMRTLFIGGGRKDKLRPGDVLGALTGAAGGLTAQAIGKIEIHDHVTYVAIDSRQADEAAAKLRAGKIKGRRFVVHHATV